MKLKLLCSLVLATFFFTSAANAETFEPANVKVLVNQKQLSFEQEPVMSNGRTLVPLRAIFEALGANVSWDGDTRTVTATKGTDTIKLTLDQTTAFKNDQSVTLDVPAVLVQGSTMVPARFVAESLGAKVGWDEESRTITIDTRSSRGESKKDNTNEQEKVITISTREQVTVSYLLTAPKPKTVKRVAILFSGSDGVIKLDKFKPNKEFGSNGSFLLRSRQLFADDQTATVVLNTPSDHPDGMDDKFRTGKEHVQDVKAVITDMNNRFPDADIYLIGTSRGTLSALYAGAGLQSQIKGIVLTSTVIRDEEISNFDYHSIQIPLLFVHHASDGCKACQYKDVEKLSSSHNIPLITINGGLPPKSGPCDPLSNHGFFGKEEDTVNSIKKWLLERSLINS